jgi:DNA polymerase alpha subunit A
VTEEEYEAIARTRMAEEDFVVDDDGQGYAGYVEDWDRARRSHSEGEAGDSADQDAGEYSWCGVVWSGVGCRLAACPSHDNDGRPRLIHGGNGGRLHLDTTGKRKRKDRKPKREARISTLLSRQAAATAAAAAANPAGAQAKKRERVSKEESADSELLLSSIFNELDEEAEKLPPAPAPAAPGKRVPARYPSPAPPARKLALGLEGRPRHAQLEDDAGAPLGDAGGDYADAALAEGGENNDDDEEEEEPSSTPTPAPATSSAALEVKVKSFLVAASTSAKASQKFIPKFQREEARSATVVGALDNADCKDWRSVKRTLVVQTGVEGGITGSPGGAARGPTSLAASGAADICEADGSVCMFWFDGFERGNAVYLFGKVLNKTTGKFVSCCLTVKGMERNVFVLPRTSDGMEGGY